MKIAIKKTKKFTKIYHGLIPGLLVPLISIYGFYLIKFSKNKSFDEFLNIIQGYGVTTQVISLCVIPNLLVFFIFIWTDRYTAAKGVILATFIYVIIVLIIKGI